ncbi:MAG TPA: hypothetical protein VFC44_27720 [Candidatus Saccharimonadales bacterium]|nr:hypothetical protein [Candidatus Saccharimonadales bacterium]
MAQDLWDAFPESRDPSKFSEISAAIYSPWVLPSLQVLAGITAADMLSPKKFNAHDMLDFHHAALAIPYCDALFCDNPMATRLRNKPCQFGQVYGKVILSRPEEIREYLSALAHPTL